MTTHVRKIYSKKIDQWQEGSVCSGSLSSNIHTLKHVNINLPERMMGSISWYSLRTQIMSRARSRE